MSLFENFITEGNEEADEPKKEGAMMDRRSNGASQRSPAEKGGGARKHCNYAASMHCLVEEWQDCAELQPKPNERWTSVDKNVEAKRHRTEWCAAASNFRCNELLKKQQKEKTCQDTVRVQGGQP